MQGVTSEGPRFLIPKKREGFHFLLNSVDKQPDASADIESVDKHIWNQVEVHVFTDLSPVSSPLGHASLACIG